MAKVLYAPMIECECGARTIFEPWTAGCDYDFLCRDCGVHNKGDIPSPGVAGREYDALGDGTATPQPEGSNSTGEA